MKEVIKPWGNFKQLDLNKKSTVKIISVNHNQMLSLQYHKKRSEMWYFLTPGVIQIRNKIRKIKKGEIVKIGKKIPHRIIAQNKKVEVLEISFGKFIERDEVRLEDKYGRK